MEYRIHSESDLDAALAGLVQADSRFGAALSFAGRPPLRRRADGFAGLASIVVSQQLSTASAKAIWGRLEGAFDPFDHVAMLRARTAKLKRAGLSAPKIRTLKAIAKAIDGGDLALQEAARLLFALEARPSAKEMGPLAEAWRPWRGAAACMLWAYYRAAKQREGAPLQGANSGNPVRRQNGR